MPPALVVYSMKHIISVMLLAAVLAPAAPAAARPADPTGCRLALGVGAAPVGTGACPGVRPGALIQIPKGDQNFLCTLNFLFRGSDGARYMGTAGHCILADGSAPVSFTEDRGEKVWRKNGPIVRDRDGRSIGRFVYAIEQGPKDFALIRLNRSVSASAQMCHFGGPIGTNTKTTGDAVLHHYGNALAIGDALPARTEYAPALDDPNEVYAWGASAPGDSGAAVIDDDGRALGVIVSGGANGIGITRIAPQVARAARKLGLRLTMVTARLI